MTRHADSPTPRPRYLADDVDRHVLRLLQLDARRPFSAMAVDLGVSDQTVARRYQRLRARAGVRVLAVTQPNIRTQEMWLLRVSAGRQLDTVALNLARRDDTAWINVLGGPGGTELVTMVYRDRQDPTSFQLLERLSALGDAVSVTAQSCMHMFFGGPGSLLTKEDAIRMDDHAPSEDPSARRQDPIHLDDADHRILAALAVDGRAGIGQLSQTSGVSQETVSRRLDRYLDDGILYFDVDFDAELLGLRSSVSLWLTVLPSAVAAAGRLLATHTEVSFAAATTGATNLYATAHCTDMDALYRYLTGPLADLPGLQKVETAPHLRSVKKAGREPVS